MIIAEAGVNHNGNLAIAKELVNAAKYAGADIVKFQTWVTEELVTRDAPKAEYQKINDRESASQYEMLKRLELSFEHFRELNNYCNEVGIKFLSTADDYKSLDFLTDELQIDLLKIGSGEITNLPFIKRFAQKKKSVILSTGMSNLGEVEQAYMTLINNGAPSVTILHCTSNYPASLDSVNLKAMLTLKEAFKTEVGYSDHTLGVEVSLAAVALGAKVIEKHFTLDKTMNGPDHAASLDVGEFKCMIDQIRNIELAISGTGLKEAHHSEIETKKIVQKGVYLAKDIMAGTVLTEEYIALKRPVDKMKPDMLTYILGKKTAVDIRKDEALKLGDINFD